MERIRHIILALHYRDADAQLFPQRLVTCWIGFFAAFDRVRVPAEGWLHTSQQFWNALPPLYFPSEMMPKHLESDVMQ